MKKIILILFTMIAANSFANETKISKFQRMPAKPIAEKIEKDTGIKIPYKPIILGEITLNIYRLFTEYQINIVKD